MTTYLDESLKRFDTVFPAAGSASSAVEMTCEELYVCSARPDGSMSAKDGRRKMPRSKGTRRKKVRRGRKQSASAVYFWAKRGYHA